MDNPGGEAAPLRGEVTLDEMDAAVKQQEQDAVDAEAQRKATAAAPAAPVKTEKEAALENALRLSEEGRRHLESQMTGRPVEASVQAEKELTREELNDLYAKDPLAAIEYMNAKSARTLSENIERRLQPLAAGTASSVMEDAKRRYPEVFELFGKDMSDYIRENKLNLSTPGHWDDMVSWMRGKSGNFEKLVEHQAKKQREAAGGEARRLQADSAGPVVRSDTRAPAPTYQGAQKDAVTAEIIKGLAAAGILDDKDPEKDYETWRKLS